MDRTITVKGSAKLSLRPDYVVITLTLTTEDQNYDAAMEQANARLWRQGQKDTVVIHHLVVKGTMDEQVMRALHDKAADQNALLAAVKARIQEVV